MERPASPFDTGRAVLSLLINGAFRDLRDINWIFSHSGGTTTKMRARNFLT